MHLRNRNKLKPPKNFDDDPNENASRMVDYRETRAISSDLDEEVYATPTKMPTHRKMAAYRGPIVRFNPYYPPAAFPSVNDADQSLPPPTRYDPGQLMRQYERENPEEAEARWAELQKLAAQRGFDHARYSIFKDPAIGQSPMPLNNASPFRTDAKLKHPSSIMVATGHPRSNVTVHQGPSNEHLSRRKNEMALVEKYNSMTNEEINMEEMATSDEDEILRAPPTSAETKVDRPSWKFVGATLQLDIVDEVAIVCNYNQYKIMQMLKLTPAEQVELSRLCGQRRDRLKREKQDATLLTEETQNRLLQGTGTLSQGTFRGMQGQTVFKIVGQEDHTTCTSNDLKNARAYLRYCGLNPSMLDWADATISTPPMASRRVPSMTKASAGMAYSWAPPIPNAATSAAARAVLVNSPGSPLREVCNARTGTPRKHLANGAPDSPARRLDLQWPQYVWNREAHDYRDRPHQSIENQVTGYSPPYGRAFGPNTVQHPLPPALWPIHPPPTALAQESSPSVAVKGMLRPLPSGHQIQSSISQEHQQSASIRQNHPQINTATSMPIRDSTLTPCQDGAANRVSAPQPPSDRKRPASDSILSPQNGEKIAKKKKHNYHVDPKTLDQSGFRKDTLMPKTTNGPLNLAGFPTKSTKDMTINGPAWSPIPVRNGSTVTIEGGFMPISYPQNRKNHDHTRHLMPAAPAQNVSRRAANGRYDPAAQVAGTSSDGVESGSLA